LLAAVFFYVVRNVTGQHIKALEVALPRRKIGIKDSDGMIDFVTLKAYIFPYINLVWIGLILMAIGFVISIKKELNYLRCKVLLPCVCWRCAILHVFAGELGFFFCR